MKIENIKIKSYRILSNSWLVNIVITIILLFSSWALCDIQSSLLESGSLIRLGRLIKSDNLLRPVYLLEADYIFVIVISIIIYFMTKLVVNVFWCNSSFIRPEPRLPTSNIFKIFKHFKINLCREIQIVSPIIDYTIILLFFICGFIIILFNLIIPIFFNCVEIEYYFILIIFTAIILTSMRNILRLDREYNGNLKLAKKIFIDNNGSLAVLKRKKTYTRYKVPKIFEEKWQKEINELAS